MAKPASSESFSLKWMAQEGDAYENSNKSKLGFELVNSIYS